MKRTRLPLGSLASDAFQVYIQYRMVFRKWWENLLRLFGYGVRRLPGDDTLYLPGFLYFGQPTQVNTFDDLQFTYLMY